MRILFTLLAASATAYAGEYAVLKTGFRIHAQAHASEGDNFRLQTAEGVIEIPVEAVASFEQEEYTPPPPARLAPVPVEAPAVAVPLSPREMITEAALKAGLPPEFVHSIAKAESAYRPDALSPKGAIGLMQLMPGTAAALHADPHDPKQNVEAGVRYLRELLIRYQDDPHQVTKAIAAYNAGPGAVDKYKGVPPYRETVKYVVRVVADYEKNQARSQKKID
jgi:soluble lytic murein transglycosylase-like protein